MKLVLPLLISVLAMPAVAMDGLYPDDNPKPPPVPFERDSGPLDNAGPEARTVHTEEVRMTGAGWLRVYFGTVELGEGSFLRIRSALDGEVQELNGEALAVWGNTSAYFNGEAVSVELVAGAGTTGNRVTIAAVAYQEAPGGFESICGVDDRLSSDQDFSGRVEPIGCSAAMWNEAGCLISAGHCFTNPGTSSVIEFRVPLNNAQCQNQHPPVADQFPITARQFTNGGVGNDWAVATTAPNNLGQTHYERYGVIRPIALTVPNVGAEMQIWGYGTDSCIVSGTQQFSEGEVTDRTSTGLFHNADTTGGNSGSGVVHDGTLIAAHTHAGCPFNGSTRIDHPSFAAARANLCIGEAGRVDLDQPAYACNGMMTVVVQDSSLIGAGTQSVSVSSDTESAAPETLVLTERYAGVFSGTITAQELPPSSGDGLLSVSHGDTATVRYTDDDDGQGGLFLVREATATMDCLPPAISAVGAGGIGLDVATISWTTDEPSNSAVFYSGPTGVFDVSDTALVTSHSLQLGGLVGCGTYTFTVSSEDSVGNVAIDDNGGAAYNFDTVCPPARTVPDGSGGTTPVTAERISTFMIRVGWDNQCVGTGSTKILYGPLQSVDQYAVTGSFCDIPPDTSSIDWFALAPGNLWFLVVEDNELGVESSWGESTFGERNGAVASGQCDATVKDLVATCP